MFLGMLLGKLLYRVLKKRRRVVAWNIKKCFPNLSQNEIDIVSRKNFTRLGQALFEICNSYFWSDKKFIGKIKNIEEFKKKI